MTIALVVKVDEGLVFASDSRTSFMETGTNGKQYVVHAYDHANKIVNLHRALPVGLTTSGLGNIGRHSIAALAKDFRQLISGDDPQWRVDVQAYSIQEIAKKFHEFIYTERYEPESKNWEQKHNLAFLIGGYSADSALPETWHLAYGSTESDGPVVFQPPEAGGPGWLGDGDALRRLVLGWPTIMSDVLKTSGGLTDEQVQVIEERCKMELQAQIVHNLMPIQDAINLARFLVETTSRFNQYLPRGSTVGGPVEIAAITRHERFKWVQRKHYYDGVLNPT